MAKRDTSRTPYDRRYHMDFLAPENLKPLLELLERFGWPLVALAGLS